MPSTKPTTTAGLVLVAVVTWSLAYLVAYGPSVMVSIDYLRNPANATTRTTSTSVAPTEHWVLTSVGVLIAVVAIVVCATLVYADDRRFSLPCPSPRLFMAAGAYGSIVSLSLWLLEFLYTTYTPDRPLAPRSSVPWIHVVGAFNAGIGEEVVVLAALVAVASANRQRSRWTLVALIVVGVCARVAYHLYYGPAAIALVPWAAVTILLFWRWRSWQVLVVFIAMHTIVDIVDGVAQRATYAAVSVALLAVGYRRQTRGVCDGPLFNKLPQTT